MQASNIPAKFPIPFGNSASNINAIPLPSQIGVQGGRASLTDGFPPLCFIPETSGGIPPWGADFNGLFKQITQWTQWQNAGGMTVFDAIFSASVGGYMQGALIASATTAGMLWMSLADNNTQNPDTTPGNPGWVGVAFITPVQNSSYISADDTGSANFYVATPLPLISGLQKYQCFQVKIANTNTSTTPTLNIIGIGGSLGAKTIINPNGSVLFPGQLTAGMIATFIFDGQFFQFQSSQGSPPQLKVIELLGSGQSMQNNVNTKVTCLTTVVRNTCATTTWDGQNLVIGAGESGLWSISHEEWFGDQNFLQTYVMIARIRSGVVKWFVDQTAYGPSTGLVMDSFAVVHHVMDLQVGDVINFFVMVEGPAGTYTTRPVGTDLIAAFVPLTPAGSNVYAYRINGF